MLLASVSGSRVIGWDVASDRATEYLGVNNLAYCAAVSRDGQRLTVGAYDGRLYVWDFEGEQPRFIAKAHEGPIYAATISSGGQKVVTGGADHKVHVWDAMNGASERSLEGHPGLVLAVSYDESRQRVLAAGKDGEVSDWKADGGVPPVSTRTR